MHVPLQAVAAHAVSVALYTAAATSFVVLALGLALLLLLGAYSPPPQVSACALSLICTYMCVRIYHIYTYHIRIVRMQTPLTDEHELPTVLAYVCIYAPNSTS